MAVHRTLTVAAAVVLSACSNGNPATPNGNMDAAVPTDMAVDASPDATAPPIDGSVTMDGAVLGCSAAAGPYAPLSTRCGHFVDGQGRVVLLTGVNARVDGVFDVTLDMGRTPLEAIPAFTATDAARMRALGFNLLRLPIQWSGEEPTQTGGFDPAYDARVTAVVNTAHAAGLLVLLDFHQDAFSKEIGEDGAPRWAIVPAPTMLLGGPLHDLGTRRSSAQVLAAFSTFFGDGADGDRLRARYAAMAAHVASRFASDPGVLGYELFNEPQATPDQLLRVYQTVGAAIRAADPGHLLVFEPDVVFRDALNHSQVPTAPFPLAGGVYAPHTYPLSFGASTDQLNTFTQDSLAPSVTSARTEATAWGTPLLITEWGYGPAGVRAGTYYRAMIANQDQSMASAVFWLWKEQSQGAWGLYDWDPTAMTWTERPAVRQALSRVHPEAIAGWPDHYGWDATAQRFELVYTGTAAVSAHTLVYVPEAQDFTRDYTVTCDGLAVNAARDPITGLLDVGCAGPGMHAVVLLAHGTLPTG